jgi:hypothetical protein
MLDWVKIRVVEDINYYLDFRSNHHTRMNSIDAAIHTVNTIVKKYPPPYTLLVSGGVDSQGMLYAWHLSGHKFKAISAVYNFSSNLYDLTTLGIMSELYKIDINYYNFDLINFLQTEHEHYANKFLCGSPHMTTFMKLADLHKDETVILSGNFLVNNNPRISANHYGLYHYGTKSNPNFIPFFYLETKELAHSFVENKYTNEFKDVYSKKVSIYQSNGFPVLPQTKKMNGFEKIKDWFDENPPRQPTVEEKILRKSGQGSNRIFDLLYRNKFEYKFSKYKYYHIC